MIRPTGNRSCKILTIKNLKTYFYTYAGVVQALNGVSLEVFEGETLGLVGETGSGKSVTALSILRLVDSPGKIVGGEIYFRDENLLQKTEDELRNIRGNKISIIFQDPMTYLNPVLTIKSQIAEAIMLHQDLTETVIEIKKQKAGIKQETADESSTNIFKPENAKSRNFSKRDLEDAAMEKVVEALTLVKMPNPQEIAKRYPHELSGGMRQRVMMAMALACRPELLICDEATTFLDVTTQAEILELLKEIQEKTGTSIILITHNLGLVAETCDRIAVMYAGDVVEYGATSQIFDNPCHPYTHGLLEAIPRLDRETGRLAVIRGSVPNLISPPSGCRFHPRCPCAKDVCEREKPELVEIEPNHFVACYFPLVGSGGG